MKINRNFINSIIFRGVVIHLLLFGFFWGISYFFTGHILNTDLDYLLFYLISLAVTIYFLNKLRSTSNEIDHQMDLFIKDDYHTRSVVVGNNELTRLYDKVLTLGESVETAKYSLENQRNQLTSVLTYMVDGVIATDRRGNVVLANNAALSFLDTTSTDIQDKPLVELLGIEDEYSFYDLLEKEPEIIVETTDMAGEYLALRVKFALFRRESGFISGIIAVLHDTTDQEKAERDRRLFVSNVSHELRTPLTSIKAYLEALEDGALNDPEVAPHFLNVSLTEANRMIRMISDLLVLSKMDQSQIQLTQEIVNLNAFMNYELNRFDQILEEKPEFTIKRELPEAPIWADIDTDKMGQVVDNLINNAIKYSPNGGQITVSMEHSDHHIRISVKDQGLGIPRKDLAKVFERFYRVDNASRNSQVGGTGLGLSIVHDIVKLHNGQISVESDGENGSTFIVVLPYSAGLNDEQNSFDDFDEFNDDWDDLPEEEILEPEKIKPSVKSDEKIIDDEITESDFDALLDEEWDAINDGEDENMAVVDEKVKEK